jgi:hypothetical protein
VRTKLLACALLLCWAPSALGYIDPGSGSFLLQGIVAGLLGLGVTLKVYWGRLFGRRSRSKPDSSDED